MPTSAGVVDRLRRELPTDQVPDRAAEVSAHRMTSCGNCSAASNERQRAVLVLRYYLGYPDVDIAETLGCRRATVRSLAARALTELRGRMPAEYGDTS